MSGMGENGSVNILCRLSETHELGIQLWKWKDELNIWEVLIPLFNHMV